MHPRFNPRLLLFLLFFAAFACSAAPAQQTSATNPKLKEALEKYPEADTDKDGVLTIDEARAYLAKQRPAGKDDPTSEARAQNPTIFSPSADEIKEIIQLGTEQNGNEPLQFEKGNGLRVVMTGHSWVAPGRTTLPLIAEAAGLTGHRQRSHTSGGGTGSANAIWLKEFGKYDKHPPRPVLLPAIANGEWDVMTWGSFYEDQPAYYTQWIDYCLLQNPDMVFYIQDGWPRFLPEFKGLDNDEIQSIIDANLAELQATLFSPLYDTLEAKYPGKVRIIPASVAVVDVIHQYYRGEAPDLDCVDEKTDGGTRGIYRDGGHLSRTSGMEHLVGYLYYGMLYKKSPSLIESYHPPNIPAAFDKAMREAAWEAITTSPFSGVR